MKTAVYIEDGVVQLVLTPENEFEKNVVKSFENKSTVTEVKAGGFYDCHGGWARHRDFEPPPQHGRIDTRPHSLIIRTTRIDEPKHANHPGPGI